MDQRMQPTTRWRAVIAMVAMTGALWSPCRWPRRPAPPRPRSLRATNSNPRSTMQTSTSSTSPTASRAAATYTRTTNPITIQSTGRATFDGTDGHQLRLTDVGASTLKNLTFTGGSYSGSGAGVKVQGNSAPTLTNLEFIDNSATGQGAGLAIKTSVNAGTTTVENSLFRNNRGAANGGGAYISTSTDVVLRNNKFFDNASLYDGGGATVRVEFGRTITVTGNEFDGNEVKVPSCQSDSAYGGGLYAYAIPAQQSLDDVEAPVSRLNQSGNTFTDNSVTLDTDSPRCAGRVAQINSYGELYGGGEHAENLRFDSQDDQFADNTVANLIPDVGTGSAEGGGLSVRNNGDSVVARNLVLANNKAEGDGYGGGGYFGSSDVNGLTVNLLHATIVKNRSDEYGGGVQGGKGDTLTLANSILWGNDAGAEEAHDGYDGFDTVTANYSDLCPGADQALAAESANNICADPLLVDPGDGDVHQTASSPTLDKASAALTGSLAKDYEGDARIQDAGGDGPSPAAPDMGADEANAPAPPAPTPAPTPPPKVEGNNQIAPGSIGEDDGYCLLGADGGSFTFGGCQFFGAAGTGDRVRAAASNITAPQSLKKLNAPMVGFAMIPADTGYWQAGADGGVFTFGAAKFYGSMGDKTLNNPIIGIASSPTGNGYYLVASDGGVFTFGDAPYLGSTGGMKLNKPIVGIAVTPERQGLLAHRQRRRRVQLRRRHLPRLDRGKPPQQPDRGHGRTTRRPRLLARRRRRRRLHLR